MQKQLEEDLEKEPIRERKKTVYVETDPRILNRVKLYESRVKLNKSLKEEQDYYKKLYEQNRANMRERMRKLKQFLKDKKDSSKTSEEFFEKYKDFFAEYGVKSYDELLKLISNYDKDNPDETDKDLIEKYKKKLKIEKQLSKEGENGFSIIPPLAQFNNIEIHNNSSENKFFIKNCKTFKGEIRKSDEKNEFNIIPDRKKYMKEKTKTYEINKIKNNSITFSKNKKIKYDSDTELIISSNNINIFLEKQENKILSKGENYTENGIPVNELINSKIKQILGKLSENDKINYQKVEQIMNNINNNKESELKKFFTKNNFCIDCDQVFDKENKEQNLLHKEHNFIHIDNNILNDIDEELNININELDYNDSLNKIYLTLKKEQNKVLKYGKNIIINFYADLLFHLYEIIVNNNSIEDLNESIIKINELYKNNIQYKEGINSNFKNYFSFYVNRITKLSYYKLKKIEKLMAELYDINNNKYLKNDEADIIDDNSDSDNDNNFFNSFKVKMNDVDKNFEKDVIGINSTNKQLENEDNKTYFLRLGLDLKFKYGKTQSISDLYNKAKEKKIEPKFYEEFIKNELNIEI